MNENWLRLLEYFLQEERIMNSKEMASHLNVSSRTVRNYVQDINDYFGKKVILSGNTGYKIENKEEMLEFLQQLERKSAVMLPQTETERVDYILSQFLTSVLSINVFDLAEDLGIAYSTLKKTIQFANEFLLAFNLRLSTRKNRLHLNGSEANKRSLMKYYLYNTSTENILSIKYLEHFFGKDIIQPILEFLSNLGKDFNLQVNDFSLRNIMLHLAIIATRNRKGDFLTDEVAEAFEIESTYPISDLEALITDLYLRHFHVEINAFELNQIIILLLTSTNQLDLVDEATLKAVEEILGELKGYQYFSLKHQDFVLPFALHLRGLYRRIELGKFNMNPLLKDIKISSPVLYDIALFVANIINKKMNVQLPEDEVAYIALHLGNAINEEKDKRNKLNTVIISPNYLELSKSILDTLKKDFQKDLNILSIIEDTSELASFEDLRIIISISDCKVQKNCEVIRISPFYIEKDKEKVAEVIKKLRLLDKKKFMRKQLDRFMDEKLFFTDILHQDKVDILKYMSSEMLACGYVSENFQMEVIEREKMSSTAFLDIAIPHSIVMNAPQTMMAIFVSEEVIYWGDETVKIVLLFSISRRDSYTFRKIYENLLDSLTKEDTLDLLKTSRNFQEFKDRLFSFW